ncbi:hypothetical protein D3C73_901310 [compost metagenome]
MKKTAYKIAGIVIGAFPHPVCGSAFTMNSALPQDGPYPLGLLWDIQVVSVFNEMMLRVENRCLMEGTLQVIETELFDKPVRPVSDNIVGIIAMDLAEGRELLVVYAPIQTLLQLCHRLGLYRQVRSHLMNNVRHPLMPVGENLVIKGYPIVYNRRGCNSRRHLNLFERGKRRSIYLIQLS